MSAVMDVLLGLILLAAAVSVLVGEGRDWLRQHRARRAYESRILEDIGILVAADAPDEELHSNQWRRDRWTAKIAGQWPRKVRL